MAAAETPNDFWHLGAVAGIIASIAGLFASFIQNLMFAIKTKNEIRRQDKLDIWGREDTQRKLKQMEFDLAAAIKKGQECELKYHESLNRIEEMERQIEEACIRERATMMLLEKIANGQLTVKTKFEPRTPS